jgi:hypothetical protein
MVNFHRVAGVQLVANEEDAYRYWVRTVSACLLAERAYGPNVVYRIRYADLIDSSESAVRALLNFVDEPFAERCLQPLAERINSSNVPADFKSDNLVAEPVIVEEAQRLSAEIDKTTQPSQASCEAAAEVEATFQQKWHASLPANQR